MLLLLVGCLDPISNRLFFEDAEFLDALPSAEDDRVQVHTHSVGPQDDDTTTELGDQLVPPEGAPFLLVLTFDSVNGVNAMVDGFLTIVDSVREIPPSSRTEDERTWGPFPMDHASGFDVRMVSKRDGLGEFTWSFDTAPEGTSDWTTFFSGTHYAGESVRDGWGSFAFDGLYADHLNGSDETPFYLFVDCRDLLGRTTPTGTRLQNDLDITLYLLDEAHVAVIQGSAYGAPGFIRLSYATSMETLQEGSARLLEFIAKRAASAVRS